jgi:hypothetical protein
MDDCHWNGCVWGRGHEGRHQVRCKCRAPEAGAPPKPDCARCRGEGVVDVGGNAPRQNSEEEPCPTT